MISFDCMYGTPLILKYSIYGRMCIKNSKLDWTLIRPGVLTNQRFKSACRVRLKPSEWRNGIVSRAAVADFIASAIDNSEMIGAEPVLSN